MNARRLISVLALTLAAGAAIAAISYRPAATLESDCDDATPAIPRVVVTATRAQAEETSVARVVVVARRPIAG
ncbi:MAG: hypothetical protein EPO27_15005 [Betaproteobacteria bacterium]|nr:MAG: hypothetical protein EPO27_15005 [Betaproteobacteria bacterium]